MRHAVDAAILAGGPVPCPSLSDPVPPSGESYYWDARRALIADGYVNHVQIHELAARKAAREMGSVLRSVWAVSRGRQ